jgi:RNA polymerase sigma-70 factor (TIGR02960 family)
VTERMLARAREGDEEAFQALTDPHRRELQVHCYRIVGAVQDAEDLLQETLLAAWRGLDRFEGRSSLRAWLYRIATNRCLNALRDSGRRPPVDPARLPPPGFERPEPSRLGEPLWLEPYPDVLVEGLPDAAPGPDARYEAKEAIGLAFVAGLQHLPPRQRAALVLRDVLGFRASEVADMLDASEASVNGALARARDALGERLGPGARERAPLPRSAGEREVVGRFAEAFERGDVDAIVALLTDDAMLTMPPEPLEYLGPEAIGRFFATAAMVGSLGRVRLVPTRANDQPAFGTYVRDIQSPVARAHGLLVLTLRGDRICAITRFLDSSYFPYFGLPRSIRD